MTLALGCLLLCPLMMGVMMLMMRDREGAKVDREVRRLNAEAARLRASAAAESGAADRPAAETGISETSRPAA